VFVQKDLKDLRRLIIEISTESGEGHIPSSLSILDILWVLYSRVLNIDPRDPRGERRDRFILSKGHASLGLYAVLSAHGFFSLAELRTFGSYKSIFGGHPDRNKVPGVEASTGSLGHGFPMSVGIALGLKMLGNEAKVYVIIGDGEANEGTVWESLLLASEHKLDNLFCIVDYNHSTDRALKIGDLSEKLEAFGWSSCIANGHDQEQVYMSLSGATGEKPHALIAETIKGHGCAVMENNPEWHHKAPQRGDLSSLVNSLY
jgi:transketolase